MGCARARRLQLNRSGDNSAVATAAGTDLGVAPATARAVAAFIQRPMTPIPARQGMFLRFERGPAGELAGGGPKARPRGPYRIVRIRSDRLDNWSRARAFQRRKDSAIFILDPQ
jgi:hypothetical protein